MNSGAQLLGLGVLGVSVGCLVFMVRWAISPAPHRGVTPPPDRRGYLYTCHCSPFEGGVRVYIDVAGPRRARRSHARR